MAFYDEMAEMAVSLLKELKTGQVSVFRRTEALDPTTDFDPEPDPPIVEDEYKADAASFGVMEEYIDGKTIFGGETQSICSVVWTKAGVVTSFEPKLGDRIKIGGISQTLVAVERIPRDGTVVVWNIISKR